MERSITIRLAFVAIYLLCNLTKVVAISQDLGHLYDCQTIGYGSHFVFQNETNFAQTCFQSHITFPANSVMTSV